ncbi:MAG: hypothetical protein ACREA3_10015 [Nitrosotalea sp.]
MKTLHLSIIVATGIAAIVVAMVIVMTLTSLSDNAVKINNGMESATSLFYHVTDTSPAPESITVPSTNIWYHAPGDKIVLSGQTLSSSGNPLEGIGIDGSIRTEQGTNVVTNHTVSDKNGNFFIVFQTPSQMSLYTEGGPAYEIHLDAIYDNKKFGWGRDGSSLFYSSLRFEDMKRFSFYVDGKNSTAELKGDGISQVSLTLDKTLKKLTLAGNVTNSQSYFDLYIPSELLGGNLTVEKSPTEIIKTYTTDYGVYGGDYQSSFGEVRMYPGVEEIKYFPYYTGNTTLEISGTTVIPEFPFSIPVLLISITSLIVFYRLKFRIN